MIPSSQRKSGYATDLISRDRFCLPIIDITRGIVVNAPTAVNAIPVAFLASLLKRLETSIPIPTPIATRAPVHKIISGTVSLRSILPSLEILRIGYWQVGCLCLAMVYCRNRETAERTPACGNQGLRKRTPEFGLLQPGQVFQDFCLTPIHGAYHFAANGAIAIDDVGFRHLDGPVARRDRSDDAVRGSLPRFANRKQV